MTKIELKKRNSFGHKRIYANCDVSKLLTRLMRKNCFDDVSLEILKQLGYEINITRGDE